MVFTIDFSNSTEMPERWKEMKDVEIKESYLHEHDKSVFVMWDRKMSVHWSYSGNELRRIYLEDPDEFISGPIEVPITEGMDKIFSDLYDNF